MSEKLYTREQVSAIVQRRVNQLNEKISELELEILMLKIDEELKRDGN